MGILATKARLISMRSQPDPLKPSIATRQIDELALIALRTKIHFREAPESLQSPLSALSRRSAGNYQRVRSGLKRTRLSWLEVLILSACLRISLDLEATAIAAGLRDAKGWPALPWPCSLRERFSACHGDARCRYSPIWSSLQRRSRTRFSSPLRGLTK